MTQNTARSLYDGLRAAIITVAVGGAVWTFSGALDTPAGGPALPQVGTVVVSHDSSRTTFNPDAQLDTTQVGR